MLIVYLQHKTNIGEKRGLLNGTADVVMRWNRCLLLEELRHGPRRHSLSGAACAGAAGRLGTVSCAVRGLLGGDTSSQYWLCFSSH